MKKTFKHIAQLNWPIAILLSVGCVGFWVPTFLHETAILSAAITLGLTILNALVLMMLNYQRSITRKHAGLPILLYLFTISLFPSLHTLWQGQVVVLLYQVILLLLRQSYREQHAVYPAFLSGISLGIATLILPDMLLFIFVLWGMFALHRAFNLRVCLASLIGLAVVGIYAFICSFLGWCAFLDISTCLVRGSINTLYVVLSVVLIGVLLFIGSVAHHNRENVTIAVFIDSLSLSFFVAAVGLFFPSAYFCSILPLVLYLITALAIYYVYKV